ncbi:MAG: hypothetical protein LBC53_10515 [Spirochaetaceae bacterium]|jgi:hypothetical protein|nr:hypothetical protein [Spirochaetaceae bacterium]
MEKNDIEKQKHYKEQVKDYVADIKAFVKRENEVLDGCRKNPDIAAVKLFNLAGEELDIASKYLIVNGISSAVLDMRNEEALNEARKSILKSIIYIENIVTGKVDAVFSTYEKFLDELADISPERKLYFIRKAGLAVDLMKAAYGDNSRWKPAFVDIDGRFAVIAKNLLDLRKAQTSDISGKDYAPITHHVRLVKKLLNKCANQFLERYSMMTKSTEDLRLAINFLSALKHFKIMLQDSDDIDVIRKKLESWKALFDVECKNNPQGLQGGGGGKHENTNRAF